MKMVKRQQKIINGEFWFKRTKDRWRKGEKYICINCKKEFIDHKNRNKKYCSQKCFLAYINMQTHCFECKKVVRFKRSQLNTYPHRGRFCSMKCLYVYYKKHRKPTTNVWEHSHGYLLQGKHYLHRRTMMEKIKRPLLKGEQIHHIDMNKKNNSIENLYLCSNQTEHNKLHWTLNRLIERLLGDKLITFDKGEYKINEANYSKRVN